MTLHCHCMLKRNNIRIHCEHTENWMRCISQLQCKCLVATIERAAAMEGLGSGVRSKEFSFQSL
jgi:hypothetical protein